MDINKFLIKVFSASRSVKCAREEIDLDNPEFGKIDPHLKVDESEEGIMDEDNEMMHPSQKKTSRKPPPFHAIFNNIKAITSKVEHIKGFKFEFTTPISQRFMLNHSWVIPYSTSEGAAGPKSEQAQQAAMMGMGKPPATSNYTLSAQYYGGTMQDLMVTGQPKYLLSARVDSDGKLDANYIKFISDKWNFHFAAQFPFGSDVKSAQVNSELNYSNDDSITTFKYATGALAFGHVQSIGDKLILGFESMFGTLQNMTLSSYGGRYTLNRRQTLYFNYIAPQDQASIAYQLLINKKCRLVSELSYKLSEGSTQTIIGFRQRLQDTETIATVSSKGKISTALNLNGMGYSLKLCAVADYLKDSYKFGYGISLGGPQ